MDETLKTELRNRLQADRERLEGEIAPLRDAVKATTYLEDENDAYDNHMADDASALHEREKDMTLLANLELELDDINRALQRMDDGGYGTCEVCGKPIAEKRLMARPMAVTCVECQSTIESRQRRHAASAEI